MRAIFTTILVLAVGGAVAFYLLTQQGPKYPQYTIELDNAFGLTEGSDMKVAGVRAGTIKTFRLDPETNRALVDFEITQEGFGSLRKDVSCESRPQSLIGEYYIDCQPGKDPQELADGATIPVEQTTSTIPLDLVNNVLRKPYRERLAIILDELGVGVAGRAEDINDVVRRASPALRETDRVLAKLASQNQTLKQLITDADTVLTDLAGNKQDVGRWVVETKETAQASAERREDIEAGLQRLPTFLRELRPTMAALGETADTNTPALRNLNQSADQLATFLENLEPFSEATQVNMRSLAKAARSGRPAVKAAQPLVAELTAGTKKAPELANNSAVVLEHLNNRKFAVEKDPRSPGGQGYTGFEAVLQWLFDQPMAINTFDKNGYILKVNLFHSKCSDYQNPDSLKESMAKDPSFYKDCAAILGPNQPASSTRRRRSRPRARSPRRRSPSASPIRSRTSRARRGASARIAARAAATSRRSSASACRTSSASTCRTSPACRRRRRCRSRRCPTCRCRRSRTRRASRTCPTRRTCPTPAPPTSSSTTCSRHEEGRSRHRIQSRSRRRRDDPRRDRRHLPVLQRQQGSAVRADDVAERPHPQRRQPRARQ
jgi:phospholipid/cholesterol/gamma-HCH transport system substrate-binding protein